MKKFHNKLFLSFILIIGLSVVASGIYTANLLKKSHIHTLQESMLREIRLILTSVSWKTDGTLQERSAYFAQKAEYLKRSADARVTFIQADGTVLADSDHDAKTMDNHLQRAEIQHALRTGIGSSIRFSDTLQRNMLYVAVPVKMGDERIGFLRLSMSLHDVETAVSKLWYTLIAGLIVLFVIAGLISYRISRQITKPLENISDVAKQIANMNYRARVDTNKKDEVGQLGEAVNRLADSLQHQMNRIRAEELRLKGVLDTMLSGVIMIDGNGHIVLLNRPAEDFLGFTSKELLGKRYDQAKQQLELTRLIQECFERREHIHDEIVFYYPEERMVEANLVPMRSDDAEWAGIVIVLDDITVLRRLERMRSDFVANVSHELKTPVAAVQGFAETLLAGALKDEETAKSFLQIIYDESRRLNRLIGDILELSKIESKRVPLQFSPVHLHSFVNETVEMMRKEAEKKKIVLKTDVPQELYLEADEDRLRQVMINLLSNAISYTPDEGTVSIVAEDVRHAQGDERVRLTVKDTGIGIPKKDIPRIFERFYRVDKARSRSSGGTGLGLSIVKHLIELHKGSIQVESQVGAGSEFMIELPMIQQSTAYTGQD